MLLATVRMSRVNPGTEPRPHLLLVAFYFPPARASGVFRARAIANHLVAHGWDVTVLTADEGFFTETLRQSDPGLLATVSSDVRVVRVAFRGRRLDRNLRHHGWFRGNFPKVADRLLQRVEERRFPDPYASWIAPAVRAAKAVHDRHRLDVVLATGNPFSSFEVARGVAASTDRPYVLDYRDSWTLNQFSEQPAYEPDSPVWEAEHRVLSAARRIVYVNHAQKGWYADRYPHVASRMIVVENGYDAEFLRVDGVDGAAPDASHGLRLGYIGTITRHLPWAELFAGWEVVREQPELAGATLELYGHLGFFGQAGSPLEALLPAGEGHRIHYRGPLPKQRIGQAYHELDVLLLVTPNSCYVTCQKVYEYMATAKPIVSVNEPGADARTPLEGYPLAFNVDRLTPDEVGEQLLRAAAAAREQDSQTEQRAREHAGRFERGRRLERLVDELEGLVDA